jgi:hypothetical protein
MGMNPPQESIEALYAAFADVPKPGHIDGCPCCIENKQICTLLSTPLRRLSGEQLNSYAFSAFLTVGDVADYLYFLPRILEISVTDDGWWPEIEVTGRAVANAEPLTWSPQRLVALQAVLETKISSLLREQDSGSAIDSWLCGIVHMGLDVRPYLAQLEQSPTHVAAYYLENGRRLPEKLDNPFWERPNAGHDAIVHWFGTKKVSDIIFDAYGVALYHSVEPAGDAAK